MLNFEIQHNNYNVSAYIPSSEKCQFLHQDTSVLGERIKKARLDKGLTLKQLGARVNLTHSALSLIENNKNDASKKTLIALAKALNDNFGEEWLNEHLNANESVPSKKEIVQDMTVKEFVSLKFGGKQTRRSREELDMLTRLLDAELERIKEEEEKYGSG